MTIFSCPRSCPSHGQHWCRFGPVLNWLGPVRVCSHTARIKVNYSDAAALRSAVEALGGKWIGAGSHRLFEGKEAGNGFTLPGWRYPLVARADGTLAYDDFNGSWGNVQDLEKLQAQYSTGGIVQRAAALGWQHEYVDGALVVYHPSGGRLTINGQSLATDGFTGGACHTAAAELGLQTTDVQPTAEGSAVAARVELPTI